MIAHVDNETKQFIKQNANLLTPISIFNLVKDYILTLYNNHIKITDIHKLLEKELEIKVNLNTLYKYINKIKNDETSYNKTKSSVKNESTQINKDDDFLGII